MINRDVLSRNMLSGALTRCGLIRRGIALRVVTLTSLCLTVLSLAGCAAIEEISSSGDIYCLNEVFSQYSEVITQLLPDFIVEKTNLVYPALQQKNTIATEAFDPQALPALEHGIANHWYPQYLATVVIAIDRSKTTAEIKGWSDLADVNEAVGIIGTGSSHMVLSAIAYGVEGENYNLAETANLLAGLRRNGLFQRNSYEPDILICYDFQAAAMIKSGHDLEIIVPREGTFTYTRGLLSKTVLSFNDDKTDSLLISAGFRLPDGRCDSSLYPEETEYETAAVVTDYDRFNTLCLEGDRLFRRVVLGTRLYSSVDNREHQLFPLLYMILLIVWTATVFYRAMQKNVRRAALLTAIILLGWMTARLIKYQIVDETALGLYLWYSYGLFQLTLPLVALLLACTIDKPDEVRIPKWLIITAAFNGVLVILIFTSHLHGFVYQIDFSKINWSYDYGYGFGYTIIQFASYSLLGLAFMMMLVKCSSSMRKKSLAFPMAFLVVLILYGYGYSTRIPIARESDITMVTGLFAVLFFESALRSGLIPANTKYTAFFKNTTLGIQLTDIDAIPALASVSAVKYAPSIIDAAIAAHPHPLPLDENTLLYTSMIRGGNALWQEDITGINRLHAELDESVDKLSASNAILAEEEKIKRILAEESEKERLMARLEAEIAIHTAKLSVMAQQLDNAPDKPKETAVIAMLLCYVKRRCNLFFREQEIHRMYTGELIGYLNELAEIAAYSDRKVTVSSDVKENISVRRVTVLYDLFFSVIEWATKQNRPHVMVHLHARNGRIIMRLLPYAKPESYTPGMKLLEAIDLAGGRFDLEDLDDAIAISLSFPKGGEDDE